MKLSKIDSHFLLDIVLVNLLSFERPKERSKEKSPAVEKLPKFFSQLLKNFQLENLYSQIFFEQGNFS